MTEIELMLKIFFYSIFGYYLFKLLKPHEVSVTPFYSIYYGLFSISTLFIKTPSIILLMIFGTIWSIIVRFLLNLIDRSLTVDIHPIWFGVFAILNYYVLDGLFDLFIKNSSNWSVFFLLFTGILFTIIDLSLTLRNAIQ